MQICLTSGWAVEGLAQHMSADLGEWPRTLSDPATGKAIREGDGGWTTRLARGRGGR